MKTLTSSIGFQDESGALLANGSLIFNLLQGIFLILAGGGQVVSRSFIVNLDGSGKVPAGLQAWASDELNTQPVYSVTLCRGANGLSPVASVNWSIAGTSPIDLNQLTAH
jgi:hypothetical protein